MLLVALVYWPTLENGFVWDDDDYVENNDTLTSLAGLRNIWFTLGAVPQYYPLAHSSFWVEYQLWGLDPRGFHAVNMLLHAASAVLVWRLLLRLAVPGAWLAAALFAVHPVCVESVAWVTERKNVLSCALALGSLLAYLRFSPPNAFDRSQTRTAETGGDRRYYALALVLFIAALLAKTVVASVPAVLLVIYWWKRGRVAWRDVLPLVPLFVVGGALACLTIWMEKTVVGARGAEWDASPVERCLLAGRALYFYAGKLAWPRPLIFVYPRRLPNAHVRWQYAFPVAALAVITTLWLARKRVGRGPLAAVLIFAGVLTPALGFFKVYPFRYSFVADHFQYHASIALVALAAAALARAGRRHIGRPAWVPPLLVFALLLPLAVAARHRTLIYKDRTTLLETTFAQNPAAWVAPADLASQLGKQGNSAAAIPYYRQAIESLQKSVALAPAPTDLENLAGCFLDLGIAQRQSGHGADAEASFARAIEIRRKLVAEYPHLDTFRDRLAWSHVELAIVQRDAKRPTDAEASFRKALDLRVELARENPQAQGYQDNAAASHVDVGLVLRARGRPGEAESWFQKAIEIRARLVRDYPTVGQYQDGLAWCYTDRGLAEHEAGRPAEAIASHGRAIEIRRRLVHDHPTIAAYRDRLAATYEDLARSQQDNGRLPDADASRRIADEIRVEPGRDNRGPR